MEDEEHFLDGCRGWRKERNALWEGLRGTDERMVRRVAGWPRQQRVDWLLGGGRGKSKGVVLRAVGVWLAKRARAGSGKAGSERWGERFSVKVQSRIDGRAAKRADRTKKRRLKSVASAATEAAVVVCAGRKDVCASSMDVWQICMGRREKKGGRKGGREGVTHSL